MREDSPDPYEPREVIGEYDDGHIVYYFCKRVDGIAHKVRAFVSPQPTRSNASFIQYTKLEIEMHHPGLAQEYSK